jgi:hypothetical protein
MYFHTKVNPGYHHDHKYNPSKKVKFFCFVNHLLTISDVLYNHKLNFLTRLLWLKIKEQQMT